MDGHSVPQLLDAFAQAAETTSSPSVGIAHTVMGKGISFMENQAKWHSGALSLDEMAQAFLELDAAAEVVKASD